jgi:ATP-binding cassette subfamily B protein
MLATTRSSWWPLWFTAAAVAAGFSTWLLGTAAVHVGTRLRRRLLDGGMRLDLDELRRTGSGDLNGRVLEAEMFEQQAVTGGTDSLFGVAQLVGALAVVAIADGPIITAAAILTWLAALVAVALVATRVRHDWTSERIKRTRLLLERFRGHRTETVYGPPPNAGGEHLDEYRDRSRRSDRAKTILLSNASVWLFAGVAVTATTATDQSLLGGLGAVLLAWSAFGVLGVAFDDLVTAATASRQLRSLLPNENDTPTRPAPATSPATDPAAPGISHVTYRYTDEGPPLLDDITMTLRPGDRVVLHGDSGSGKSSLGSVLAGIRPPTTGTVHGVDRVVYVAQFGDNHTFQASLGFNVLLGREWPPATTDLDAAADLLADLGLADLAERMPRGLAQPVGDAGWQLSHGERGRIYLARALAQQPDAIVLDESLEGLDPRTVTATLATTNRRVSSIVVISHR